jgi:hypothetical protein
MSYGETTDESVGELVSLTVGGMNLHEITLITEVTLTHSDGFSSTPIQMLCPFARGAAQTAIVQCNLGTWCNKLNSCFHARGVSLNC